ncbi:MAG: phage tail tube protein [Pseudomonadota bacterium]
MSGISSQGSTLEIETGNGSPVSITAIAAGFPTIITATGLVNGDVVAIAALGGADAATVNGHSYVVQFSTGLKASLDVDTTGKTITAGSGTATPAAYTKINGILSYSGLDGSAPDIDVTDLDSTAMEYISGLKDEGKFGFEMKTIRSDAGQLALEAARTSGAVKGIRLTLPDDSVATFDVLVKTTPLNGAVNAVLKGSVDCKITGDVTWA